MVAEQEPAHLHRSILSKLFSHGAVIQSLCCSEGEQALLLNMKLSVTHLTPVRLT